jgi:hypothetical protein
MQMNDKCLIAASLFLAFSFSVASAADRKPSAKEIAAARAECNKYRRKVEKLETDPKSDPALLAKETTEYEHACARAEALMQAAGMEKPRPPQPAPPPPTIVIEQKPPKPVIIDEPSVPPTVPPGPYEPDTVEPEKHP